MPFLTRYEDDDRPPALGSALRDIAVRAIAPGVLVWLALFGIGLLITGPLGDPPAEDAAIRALQQGRTPVWDGVTMVWSRLGNTEIIIATCLVMVAILWWRTRRWWIALIPALAISLQATIFVTVTTLVDRNRPQAQELDPAPPTSSYPSGHVGAAFALYLSLALVAHRVPNPVLRRTLQAVCLVVPFLVAFARMYRGMHHPSDVLVGMGNGVVCALLAWGYLRRRD